MNRLSIQIIIHPINNGYEPTALFHIRYLILQSEGRQMVLYL